MKGKRRDIIVVGPLKLTCKRFSFRNQTNFLRECGKNATFLEHLKRSKRQDDIDRDKEG